MCCGGAGLNRDFLYLFVRRNHADSTATAFYGKRDLFAGVQLCVVALRGNGTEEPEQEEQHKQEQEFCISGITAAEVNRGGLQVKHRH